MYNDIEKAKKKCARWGHKWVPVFIAGEYNGIHVRFIACYCQRCRIGYNDIGDAVSSQTQRLYNTREQMYYDNDIIRDIKDLTNKGNSL